MHEEWRQESFHWATTDSIVFESIVVRKPIRFFRVTTPPPRFWELVFCELLGPDAIGKSKMVVLQSCFTDPSFHAPLIDLIGVKDFFYEGMGTLLHHIVGIEN